MTRYWQGFKLADDWYIANRLQYNQLIEHFCKTGNVEKVPWDNMVNSKLISRWIGLQVEWTEATCACSESNAQLNCTFSTYMYTYMTLSSATYQMRVFRDWHFRRSDTSRTFVFANFARSVGLGCSGILPADIDEGADIIRQDCLARVRCLFQKCMDEEGINKRWCGGPCSYFVRPRFWSHGILW